MTLIGGDGRWISHKVFAGFRARDEPAWQVVYARALSVTSWRRWHLDRADSEDLAQQAVLHVFERADQVRDPVAFQAFVRTATVRIVLTFINGRKRWVAMDTGTDDSVGGTCPAREPSVNPGERLDAIAEVGWVGHALELLPADCGPKIRVWLDWKVLGGYATEREAAAVFGQSLGTFSARVSRCLEALRAVMQVREEVANAPAAS